MLVVKTGPSHSERRLNGPPIPDHEVSRCIGHGSYGEVWMARAVTGVLRAVKVVRREDFELERTFEREFEGIRGFEPISRSHPGLIDILHVGRNHAEAFYYYVMELADDRYRGRSIVPGEYECRTLATDKQDGGNIDLDAIIQIGLSLADALGHLHEHGLIHRDVKPSNIVFIDGVAQLADIGLVAAYGQRTYVGTEGFVPPEGPGTPQADTYSLGMVLYELSTGKDRLEFPAVPDDFSRVGDKKKWLALNEVICRACAPLPADRYPHARDMAEDLRRVLVGRRSKKKSLFRRKRFWAAAALVGAFALSQAHKPEPEAGPSAPVEPTVVVHPPSLPEAGPTSPEPEVAPKGNLRIVSDPSGASVWIEDEPATRGVTPLEITGLPAGDKKVVLRLPRHREVSYIAVITDGQTTVLTPTLEFWSPPVPGQPWRNSQNMEFLPQGDEHVAVLPTTRDHFVQAHGGSIREGETLPWIDPQTGQFMSFIVFVPKADAETYRDWSQVRDLTAGYFSKDHYYRIEPVEEGINPDRSEDISDHLAFRLVAGLHLFGDVIIETTPPGAEVFIGNASRPLKEVTPLKLEHQPIGSVEYSLRLPGFLPTKVGGEIKAGEIITLAATLERSRVAVFDQEWTNSLGMKFRPIEGRQFALWEARMQDYQAFIEVTGHPHETDLDLTPLHPVVAVNRADAEAFCQWLTEKERHEGLIEKDTHYRLPTDAEWSLAAGIPSERGGTPGDRHLKIRGEYPWGFVWPPPPGSGNYADESAVDADIDPRSGGRLKGNDGFPSVAPVGSFTPNANGLYDIGGNVSEWVIEDFGGTEANTFSSYGVVRGGSWSDCRKEDLHSSFRKALGVEVRDSVTGFRVVLARGAIPSRDAPKPPSPGRTRRR